MRAAFAANVFAVFQLNIEKTLPSLSCRLTEIDNEQDWIQILNDRNSASHLCGEDDVKVIYERIISVYMILFDNLLNKLS